MKKNIIITGCANGIGASCIKEFYKKGYNIIAIDREKIVNKYSNVDYYECDISNKKQVTKCMSSIMKKYHQIDILINNAAIQIEDTFENYNLNEWQRIMNTNFFGTCNMIHDTLKMMKINSTILNISSVHSKIPRTGKYAYDSSKSAIEILTKELALELAPKGITINVLAFGAVNTKMNDEWKKFPEKKIIAQSKVPLNIIFEPKDVAKFCCNIIECFSKYTTGSIFTIDGGRSLI